MLVQDIQNLLKKGGTAYTVLHRCHSVQLSILKYVVYLESVWYENYTLQRVTNSIYNKSLFSHVCHEISIKLTGVKSDTFHNIGIYFYVTMLTASSDRSLHSSTAMYCLRKYRISGFYVVRQPDCRCSRGEFLFIASGFPDKLPT